MPVLARKRKKMAKNEGFKPGQSVPTSGQWGVVGPRGGNTGQEVTSSKGEPFPPTQKAGSTYRLNDKTK